MPTLLVAFDDPKQAEIALERLDDAGFPLGTYRLHARGRSLDLDFVDRLRHVARRLFGHVDDEFRGVEVEVQGDASSLERALVILRRCGGSTSRRAP
jgi:hypothetical protein